MRQLGSALAVLACAGCAVIQGEPIESRPVPQRPAAPAPGTAPATAPAAAAAPVAPVAEAPKPRRGRMQGDTRPESYVVERGDTLFGIALDFGLDYRELAAWNGIPDPSRIFAGQRLRLLPPETGGEPQAKPLPAAGPTETEALVTSSGSATETAAAAAAEKTPTLSEPRAVTLPWGEKAFAQLGGNVAAAKAPAGERKADAKPESRSDARPEANTEAKSDSKPESKADAKSSSRGDVPGASRPDAKPAVAAVPSTQPPKPAEGTTTGDDWVWPARGSLVYRFGDSGALKGLGIAGKAGSPVVAAAPGRVVYSGSGLRGYGKLVIIKHGEEYLTVYAHNRALVVKEGEQVRRGQRIAEMGDTDADRVALHFELRRFGKPVDPLSQLPGDRPPS